MSPFTFIFYLSVFVLCVVSTENLDEERKTMLKQLSEMMESSMAFVKCCGVDEMLDKTGRRCVVASRRDNVSLLEFDDIGVVSRFEPWLKLWIPPGIEFGRFEKLLLKVELSALRPKNIRDVGVFIRSKLLEDGIIRSVNSSSIWHESDAPALYRPEQVVVTGSVIVRSKPGGGTRNAMYCLDAAPPPLGPFALVYRMALPQRKGDQFMKCCPLRKVLVDVGKGLPKCGADKRGWTTHMNSSLSKFFDEETPFVVIDFFSVNPQNIGVNASFHTMELPNGDAKFEENVRGNSMDNLFSSYVYMCTDLERGRDGELKEVLGYFYLSRRTRGAFLLSRKLSFVSTLLLVMALVGIMAKERTRKTVHGWALGSHTACLLLFNFGQMVFQLIPEGRDVDYNIHILHPKICMPLAFSMYFLQTSAGAWMTAVCFNMYMGFRKTHGARAGGSEGLRFLKIGACAWGFSLLFTVAAVSAFLTTSGVDTDGAKTRNLPWYRPTFMETRTCYTELADLKYDTYGQYSQKSQKSATTLFYYFPLGALVVANMTFLTLTALKVRYLRRGNSMLKRDERENAGTRGSPPRPAGEKRGDSPRKTATAEPNTVLVYIKLLLAGGAVEFVTEAVFWSVSSYQSSLFPNVWRSIAEFYTMNFSDHTYAYRTAGYWSDFARAIVVVWLAIPEPPNFAALWRRLRGM